MILLETDQAETMIRGIASAVRHRGALTDIQTSILTAVGTHVLGIDIDATQLEPLTAAALRDALPEEALRRRAVHAMTILEIVRNPLPPEVAAQVDRYAQALDIDEDMLVVARDYSKNAMDVATGDLIRNAYPAQYYAQHTPDRAIASSPVTTTADPQMAAKWEALEDCPSGSHGRAVWDFYQMRGFRFPGTPGAVDHLLAQHDWVHCLADYGSSATGEIEVFTFIASAIPDPKGFSYVVSILGLFETGYLALVPGVATADPGHLSKPGGTTRFADALRRGLATNLDVMGRVDWFQYANDPIEDVRQRLSIPPKSTAAVSAGSLSALDPNAVWHGVSR
jgi:hypothetical protein